MSTKTTTAVTHYHIQKKRRAEFIAAIRAGQPPPIDVYRALDYTVPGLISEQSIAQGGVPLPIPDFRL